MAVAVGSLKSLTTEHAESVDRATNRGKEETLKFNKIPTKFRILRGGYRREARIALLKNIFAPKPAAAVLAGRYGGGIIIAPEYKPAAGACRSPGARGA